MASQIFVVLFILQAVLIGTTFGGESNSSCAYSAYRSLDGSCNNLAHPDWGKAFTVSPRLLPSNYGDNFSSPTLAVSGSALPNSSIVSETLYVDKPFVDPRFTIVAMHYGQVAAHDLTLVATIIEPNTTDGKTVPEQQLSQSNSFLDLSLVYGITQTLADTLRDNATGFLVSETRDGREWLPANPNSNACVDQGPGTHCYNAGDFRVNQNPQIALGQTLLLREHNRIAGILSKLNPSWSGDKLYNETRKINIAQHEWRVKYELLPVYLGVNNSVTKGAYKYNSSIDPTVLTEFSSAAYRFFHSLIAGLLTLYNEDRSACGRIHLGPTINSPGIIEQNETEYELARGLGSQAVMGSDRYHTAEITNATGLDLKTVDVNRNRQRGIASYNNFRVYVGLPKAKNFTDFEDVIKPALASKLADLYESPDDVELTVGGSLETLVNSTLSGPTFLKIITEQFHRTINGDRYWFENDGQFTSAQLAEFSKATISKLICDNSEGVEHMQRKGFLKNSTSNPLVPCSNFTDINWSLWKESNASSSTRSLFASIPSLSSGLLNWFRRSN